MIMVILLLSGKEKYIQVHMDETVVCRASGIKEKEKKRQGGKHQSTSLSQWLTGKDKWSYLLALQKDIQKTFYHCLSSHYCLAGEDNAEVTEAYLLHPVFLFPFSQSPSHCLALCLTGTSLRANLCTWCLACSAHQREDRMHRGVRCPRGLCYLGSRCCC